MKRNDSAGKGGTGELLLAIFGGAVLLTGAVFVAAGLNGRSRKKEETDSGENETDDFEEEEIPSHQEEAAS